MRERWDHRGIGFQVKNIAGYRWGWEVRPPATLRGWYEARGEVIGGPDDAVMAAKAEIDAQDRRRSFL
jgi:hypothetical protein